MNSIKFKKLSHGVAFFVFMLAASLVMSRVPALADTGKSESQHLLTIHDRGAESSFITKRETLREVFEEANIRLDKNDIVEPGLDEKLTAKDYQVNVYRARPVTIIDGATKIQVMSAYQSPRQIADAAGIELHDEDIADIAVDETLVRGSGAQMTIDRATPITLNLYGKNEPIYTQATTVGELLKEKSIKLGAKDSKSLADGTAITPNMTLQIWREGKQTITREEKIQPKVKTLQSNNYPAGYRKIKDAGKVGRKSVTYEILIKNGKEASRKQIQSIVIQKSQPQTIVVGTRISLPPGSHEDWMRKAGIAESNYGYVNAIFSQESGWNPGAVNPVGYYGLGQTSLSNIVSACPNWRNDPICQIKFFNNYANSRYGSWQNAYYFKFGQPGVKAGHGWW